MSQQFNIIGDIAGRFDTLRALLRQMPAYATPLSVGDMVDRGPKSREVLEFFKQHGKALLGNHEHMMLCAVRQRGYYEPRLWENNGGDHTLASFWRHDPSIDIEEIWYGTMTTQAFRNLYRGIPEDLLDWLDRLPLHLDLGDVLVTHAPKPHWKSLEDSLNLGAGFLNQNPINNPSESTVLWNRVPPKELPGKLQIFGHNSFLKAAFYAHDDFYGTKHGFRPGVTHSIGIDSSRGKVLTGIHYPSLEIFQQPFVEQD